MKAEINKKWIKRMRVYRMRGVTLTARGALIYNTTTDGGTGTTDAVAVLDFGGDKTATAGTFTVQFPAFTTSAAILRIA